MTSPTRRLPGSAFAALALLLTACASRTTPTAAPPATPRLPQGDPLLSALEKRLGSPDRVTGSGRLFLHYDLANGDTLTLVVSGDQVAGVQHDRKSD